MLPDNDLYHRRSIPSSLARLALIGIASATGLAAATGINAAFRNANQVNGVRDLVDCGTNSLKRSGSTTVDPGLNPPIKIGGSQSYLGHIEGALNLRENDGKLVFDTTEIDGGNNEIVLFDDGTIEKSGLTTFSGNRARYVTPQIIFDIEIPPVVLGPSEIRITATCAS